MSRLHAMILTMLATAALAGCLDDADTAPAAAPGGTDVGSDEPEAEAIPEIEPPLPTATPAPTPVAVEVASKECLVKIGLLGIRVSAC